MVDRPIQSPETELIDLSIGIEPDTPSEPWPPEFEYRSHEDVAELIAGKMRDLGYDVSPGDFPDGKALGEEKISTIVHTGTHIDAPWHYGPESEGERARTIDELPLEWFRGTAVVLDFTWKEPGGEITPGEIDEQLAEIDHELSPGEILLIETGADEHWGTEDYLTEFPGMGAEATKHVVEQGVKVIGTDGYGFDKPFADMGRRFTETGDSGELWPAHMAGREVEYCQIEKMANLDALPRRTDIPLVTFPVNIKNGSAGWARPVAFIGDE
jgi:kynurenine formamidase